MKLIAHVFPVALFLGVLAGCQATPAPGMASARLQVVAKPKAGVKESFERVPVYDAAPTRAVPKGQYAHVDYFRLSDIIVWLEPETAGTTRPSPHSGVDQVVFEVDPGKSDSNVHPLSVGQTLVLRNSSTRPIAPYCVSDGNEFDMPPIGPNLTRMYVVKSEGPIEILVDPAKPPVALAYAAPSPWVARARSGQTVEFDDLPPGRYRAVSWHPRLPSSATDVVLQPGQVANVTLTVGVDSMAQAEAPR
jgi:hypothetical protein